MEEAKSKPELGRNLSSRKPSRRVAFDSTLQHALQPLLFLGISYLAFLKAGMPKVNVRAFNITKLQVDDGSQKMDAVIGLGLLFSNKNDKIKLLYGPLSIDVTSENVLLGKTKVREFSQKPMNDTNLNMTMTLDNADVNKHAADDLKQDIKAYEMVFDVYVGGHIGFQVASLQMNNVPFLASCHQIKRMDVDFGRRPECAVKMFAFRPSTN
ncbi:Late embryogenesis abundant protein, LEA-14 [Spatholobus suberectus]|nr:Late embryogenesis abundant protein, LEA-14 [Spatholobus suberectus]